MRWKQNKTITKYWLDHYVNMRLQLCSLCGNTGVIDTTDTAVSPAGCKPGRKNPCICPNGQLYRQQQEEENKAT